MSIAKEASPNAPAESSRVSQYWQEQFEKNRADRSLWTNNVLIMQHLYRLISGGSPEHWLFWFLNHYVPGGLAFERSLSVCCGDGAHELILANSGSVEFIRGFDLSAGAIAQAKAAFVASGIPEQTYRFEVADADALHIDDHFDFILSTGALHHVNQLQTLLERLSRMLDPDGYFVALEYVGPNRFQWRDPQLNIVNDILRRLDPRYLKDNRLVEVERPPLAQFLAIDPSEAVHSEEVLRLLGENFTIEYLSNFNGTLIHPLYPLLNDRFTNANDPGFDGILKMVLLMEDLLIRHRILSSDFVFAICRNKMMSAQAPSKPKRRTRRFFGHLDTFDEIKIAGWAVDLSDPTAQIVADLYLDDQFHATVCCDTLRPDLVEAGYGDGSKSFELPLTLPEKVQPAVVKMVLAGSDKVLATRRYGRAGVPPAS